MKTIRDILHGGCGCALALLAAAHPAQSDIIRVHPNPPASGPWQDAETTIEDALALAGHEDEIWIYQGTYVPGAPGTERTDTFLLPEDDGLYTLAGNFNGTEEFITERDHVNPAHATILSGLFGQDPGDPGGRVFHVVTGVAGLNQQTVRYRLDALTIRHGWATGQDGDPHSWPEEQPSAAAGGGVYLFTTAAALTLCTLENNYAGSRDTPNPDTCYNYPGTGGAIFQHSQISPVTTIQDDYSLDLVACTFKDNEAWFEGRGGAIGGTNVYIRAVNTVFFQNRAIGSACVTSEITIPYDAFGGAVALLGPADSATFVNCTIVDNEAISGDPGETVAEGGVLYGGNQTEVVVHNSIVRGNLADEVLEHIANTGTVTVTYTNIEGGWSGTGNIDADPLFVNRSIGNLRLQACSPSIDAGDEGLMVADVHDINRNDDLEEPAPDRDLLARVAGSVLCTSGTVDQGAFERPFHPADFDCNSAVDFQDLLVLLAAYGDCPESPDPCPWDLDGNGAVGFSDLLILLSWWTSDSQSCLHVTLGSIWDCINEIGLAPEDRAKLEACIEAMIINGTP
ncbi:MAG: hypothetical protein KF817_05300 [Phycisphaeraceae bacterium]|nr:hypothetical protein [Phycisphaeraceae bacterium]